MIVNICFNTGFSACFNLFQQPNQFFVHRFRTQSTFSAQIPISASAVARIIVSCSKNAHARRGLQEPPGRVIVGSLRLGGYLFLNNFSTSFFHNFDPQNDPKSEPKSMKNEVEKRTRKRKSKSKKKYEKKTPRRDAKTSKTKQNAERGDDFRKMHISAQWTNKLQKVLPKSSKNDPKMRHNSL